MTGIEIGLIVIGGGAFLIGSATSTYLVKRREERKREAKVFGKPLEDFKLKRLDDCGVPILLEKWFQRIEKEGVDTEGIFRISSSQTVLMELYKKIDLDGGKSENFDEQQIHVISGLIKLYLRELPDCLLCYKYYNEFLQIEKTEDDIEKWKEKIQATLDKIPDRNALLLQRLLQMLTKVKEKSEENKMTADNLAVVFGPCLIFSLEPKEALSLFSDSSTITSLVTKLIENATSLNLKRDFQPLDPKKRKKEKIKKEKKKDPENGEQTPDLTKSKKEKKKEKNKKNSENGEQTPDLTKSKKQMKEEKRELKKKKKEEKKKKDNHGPALPDDDHHELVGDLANVSTAQSSLDLTETPKKSHLSLSQRLERRSFLFRKPPLSASASSSPSSSNMNAISETYSSDPNLTRISTKTPKKKDKAKDKSTDKPTKGFSLKSSLSGLTRSSSFALETKAAEEGKLGASPLAADTSGKSCASARDLLSSSMSEESSSNAFGKDNLLSPRALTSYGDSSSVSVSPSESLDSLPSTPASALSPRVPSDDENRKDLSPKIESQKEENETVEEIKKDIAEEDTSTSSPDTSSEVDDDEGKLSYVPDIQTESRPPSYPPPQTPILRVNNTPISQYEKQTQQQRHTPREETPNTEIDSQEANEKELVTDEEIATDLSTEKETKDEATTEVEAKTDQQDVNVNEKVQDAIDNDTPKEEAATDDKMQTNQQQFRDVTESDTSIVEENLQETKPEHQERNDITDNDDPFIVEKKAADLSNDETGKETETKETTVNENVEIEARVQENKENEMQETKIDQQDVKEDVNEVTDSATTTVAETAQVEMLDTKTNEEREDVSPIVDEEKTVDSRNEETETETKEETFTEAGMQETMADQQDVNEIVTSVPDSDAPIVEENVQIDATDNTPIVDEEKEATLTETEPDQQEPKEVEDVRDPDASVDDEKEMDFRYEKTETETEKETKEETSTEAEMQETKTDQQEVEDISNKETEKERETKEETSTEGEMQEAKTDQQDVNEIGTSVTDCDAPIEENTQVDEAESKENSSTSIHSSRQLAADSPEKTEIVK